LFGIVARPTEKLAAQIILFAFQTFFLLSKCGHRNVLSKRQVWMSIFVKIKSHSDSTVARDLWNWFHQYARVFDWQQICYLWWTCVSTDSRHTYGYKLCSSSRRLVPCPNYFICVSDIFFIKQVWTQKCAVQKASVDVNISYY
jgi:hypothetical protein